MDYKQKYEEALERATQRWESGLMTREELEGIFPELAESEDEKIRKVLIDLVKCNERSGYKLLNNVRTSSMLAWLEKQGKSAKLSEEEQNRFAKGVLSSCALSFINYLDAHKYEGKMCVSNGECEDIENAFHNAMWDRLHRYYCKYIEKNAECSLEEAAHIFLKALSESPYNNKPITDAQIVTKELLKFLSDAKTYNPDALLEHEYKIKIIKIKE